MHLTIEATAITVLQICSGLECNFNKAYQRNRGGTSSGELFLLDTDIKTVVWTFARMITGSNGRY